ncbi:hypothetical protein [Variovorax gossypii]
MTNTTCLQYVTNGMTDRIFSFAEIPDGKKLLMVYKKLFSSHDERVKELLIAYNSYFMVQAAIGLRGMPKTPHSVVEFMFSEEFNKLQGELTQTIQDNYSMLMSCLSRKQKRKLEALLT